VYAFGSCSSLSDQTLFFNKQVLSHNDEFFLLACDGLFDVFRSQDAIALAPQELIAHRGEPAKVARILSNQAIWVQQSHKKVILLIIVLRPFWEL
jgi:serine/threonine protein phosphatase PrpC